MPWPRQTAGTRAGRFVYRCTTEPQARPVEFPNEPREPPLCRDCGTEMQRVDQPK